jgi:hypothetical protein
MLSAIEALLTSDAAPLEVDYQLEWTEVWDDATVAAAGSRPADRSAARAWLSSERILEELRLDPEAHAIARDRTLLRHLARREAERRRQPGDARLQRAALDRLRMRLGLFRRTDLDRWLEANELDAGRLEQLLADEAHLRDLIARPAAGLDDRLLDDLRLHGDYAATVERARAKGALLASLGLDHPRPEDVGVAPAALLAWYFERHLKRPLPDDIDGAAREQGFESRDHFIRAVLREWLYCRATSPQAGD